MRRRHGCHVSIMRCGTQSSHLFFSLALGILVSNWSCEMKNSSSSSSSSSSSPCPPLWFKKTKQHEFLVEVVTETVTFPRPKRTSPLKLLLLMQQSTDCRVHIPNQRTHVILIIHMTIFKYWDSPGSNKHFF